MPRPVVLVTGGARGIGRAIAEALSPDHDIAITYRTAADDAAVFASAHPDALLIEADLATTPAEDLVAQVLARFGRIDGLVNNAGMIAESPFEAFDIDASRRIFEINTIAPMALIAAAAKHMWSGGAIVNITSINASSPPASAPAYGASKAALENITLGAAKALGGKGIRVNAVAPGAVERDHAPRPAELIAKFLDDTALGRQTTLNDIAETVRFLISPTASGITGEILTVSGGYRL